MADEVLLCVIREIESNAAAHCAVLIGLSGAGPLFTQEVLEALNDGCQHQNPVVMPMSNPTARMECTAEQAQRYTGGRAVFASGSPQDDQEWNGATIASTQANNMCAPCAARVYCVSTCCTNLGHPSHAVNGFEAMEHSSITTQLRKASEPCSQC